MRKQKLSAKPRLSPAVAGVPARCSLHHPTHHSPSGTHVPVVRGSVSVQAGGRLSERKRDQRCEPRLCLRGVRHVSDEEAVPKQG